jgi:hypothetical protein
VVVLLFSFGLNFTGEIADANATPSQSLSQALMWINMSLAARNECKWKCKDFIHMVLTIRQPRWYNFKLLGTYKIAKHPSPPFVLCPFPSHARKVIKSCATSCSSCSSFSLSLPLI